jgi:predicted short-subunit dehydrogenase-like oxidoreductase (DUF2520 family)
VNSVKENKANTVTLVGAGNVAWHLAHTFSERGIRINKIINRSAESASRIASETETKYTTDFGVSNSDSDFTILAIDDSYIEKTLGKINCADTIVLHTSGSTGMDIFNNRAQRFGVFYPVQSFTKNKKINFSNVPVCIEASDKVTLEKLHGLASIITNHVHHMNSEQRRVVHLAGVMANNFTNHILALTFDILETHAIDRKIIVPLIEETFNKIKYLEPKVAQTGPARRNNMEIIRKHLKVIEGEPAMKNLYNAISESIIAYYSTNS